MTCRHSSSGRDMLASTESATASLLEFASLDELDPSLAEDFKLWSEREAPLELRSCERNGFEEPGTIASIRFRVLVKGLSADPQAVRVELTSESDLFFNFTHTIDQEAFRRQMQQEQRLMIDFDEYPTMLLRLLNNCIQSPTAHIAVLLTDTSNRARLDFIQNMDYKFVELLSCQFQAPSDEHVKQQLTFRYNAVKSRLALMEARLADINALVKSKNPSLMLQLQAVPPRMPSHTASLLSISDGLSSPNKTLLTSLKRSPSAARSPGKTLPSYVQRSSSNIRSVLQQSGGSLSSTDLPWAY